MIKYAAKQPDSKIYNDVLVSLNMLDKKNIICYLNDNEIAEVFQHLDLDIDRRIFLTSPKWYQEARIKDAGLKWCNNSLNNNKQ